MIDGLGSFGSTDQHRYFVFWFPFNWTVYRFCISSFKSIGYPFASSKEERVEVR